MARGQGNTTDWDQVIIDTALLRNGREDDTGRILFLEGWWRTVETTDTTGRRRVFAERLKQRAEELRAKRRQRASG